MNDYFKKVKKKSSSLSDESEFMKLSNKTGATCETWWPVEFITWPSWQLVDINLFIIQAGAHTHSLRTPRGKQKAANIQVVNKSSSCCLSKSIKLRRRKALRSGRRIGKSDDDGGNSGVGLKKVILQSLLRVLSLSNKRKDWRKEGPARVQAVLAPGGTLVFRAVRGAVDSARISQQGNLRRLPGVSKCKNGFKRSQEVDSMAACCSRPGTGVRNDGLRAHRFKN